MTLKRNLEGENCINDNALRRNGKVEQGKPLRCFLKKKKIPCIFWHLENNLSKHVREQLELLCEVPCARSFLSSPQMGISYIVLSSCRLILQRLPLENLLYTVIWVKEQHFKVKIKHKDIFPPVTLLFHSIFIILYFDQVVSNFFSLILIK